MKKIMTLAAILALMLMAGCHTASDLIEPSEETAAPQISTQPTEEPEELDVKTTIPLTQTLKMTNEWTILGDFSTSITKKGVKDRIVLGTSAQSKNGEMMWDDSQYWTLAVITEHGAYNLFSERMQGYVYTEVSEAFIQGVATPVITAYIFSGTDRDIRNYIFEDGVFVEYQEYTTKQFSTGGINNLYSSIPEYTEK
ncbi:MAG: hypothetical protein J6C82_03660 [Clostridia bacterium]|nr:hypothetical protein [Clostridia bacterium]